VTVAVVLLSGGLDSATCAALARRDGCVVHALSIDYGQRQRAELDAARRIGAALGVASHRVVRVDLRAIGGSALTDAAIDVPKDRADEEIAHGVPSTYVPARNTLLLALATGLAEVVDADAVFLGINAVDFSGYPDCRPEFLEAFRAVARLGTKRGSDGRPVAFLAPLLALSKAEIVRLATELRVPVAATLSCYDPVAAPGDASAAVHCGRCDACRLRQRGFHDAGLADPTTYAG
jgi:7-cyano-7-deazaguanine synthase